jgi:CHAT domain-containing protein/tetratricopeptide (TPR) repeat protein
MRRSLLILSAILAFGATLALSASQNRPAGGAPPAQSVGPDQFVPAHPKVLALLAEAETARLALRLDDAQARVDEATALAEQVGDKDGLAAAHRMKGSVLDSSGRTTEGKVWFSRARDEFEAIGDRRGLANALMGLTNIAINEGQTAQADELGASAMQILQELGDEAARATVLINLVGASTQVRADDPRIDEVLAIANRLGDEDLLATALKTRAGLQWSAGDLAGAKATLDAAVAAYEHSHDVSGTAASYLMIGRIMRAHNDFEDALLYYQRAIDLLAPTSARFNLVEAVNASGVALGHLGRHIEAIAAYERGLALARETGNTRLIDFMLGNYGGGLLSAGETLRAIPILQEVLARNPEPYIAAFRYGQLANAFGALGRYDEALGPATEALRIARELNDAEVLEQRLDDRTWILTRLGRFEDALADLRATLDVTSQVRAKLLPSDFLKRGYGDRVQKYYSRGVDLLTRLDRGPEALELAEQGRARALLDLLAAREAPDVGIATRGATVVELGSTGLRSDAFAKPLAIDGMRAVARRLDSTLLLYWVAEECTVVWTVGPDGATWSTRLSVGSERVAELVAATTAPLRAGVRPAANSIGPSPGIQAPTQTDEDIIAMPLRGLGLLALTRDDRAAWRELYGLLIDPVRAHLPARGGRVTIAPHGPLSRLAFAALQSAGGRYLVEDFDLSVAPSVSVLAFTGRREQVERAGRPGPWMLVGNPVSLPEVGGRALAPLAGAASEIGAIARLAPRGDVIRLEANRADETAFTRALDAAHPSVVHFATHGFVLDDPKTPPFLVMNRRGDDASGDGRLTMDEVYGLTLTSDLVVLSACRSGAGAVSSDGVIGLARAFLYAGTPSVMATLWDVPDATTALLMPRFYRRYAATREKSASLRAAELALLADLRAGRVAVSSGGRRVVLPEHPLLWAGFVLIGEPGTKPPTSSKGDSHDR